MEKYLESISSNEAKNIGITKEVFQKAEQYFGQQPNGFELHFHNGFQSVDFSKKIAVLKLNSTLGKETLESKSIFDAFSKVKVSGKCSSLDELKEKKEGEISFLHTIFDTTKEKLHLVKDLKNNFEDIRCSFTNRSTAVAHQFSLAISPEKFGTISKDENYFLYLLGLENDDSALIEKFSSDIHSTTGVVAVHHTKPDEFDLTLLEIATFQKCGLEINLDKLHEVFPEFRPGLYFDVKKFQLICLVQETEQKKIEENFYKSGYSFRNFGKSIPTKEIHFTTQNKTVVRIETERIYTDFAFQNINQTGLKHKNGVSPVELEDEFIDLEELVKGAGFLTQNSNITARKLDNVPRKYFDAKSFDFPGIRGKLYLHTGAQLGKEQDDSARLAMIAYADAIRGIVCRGATPIATTFCHSGIQDSTPTLSALIEMSEKFDTPLIPSKNKDKNIDFPATSVLAIGISGEQEMSSSFKQKGDLIFLLGDVKEEITRSEYFDNFLQMETPLPSFSIGKELALQQTLKDLIQLGFINSAYSVSKGGVFMAMTEMAMQGDFGFDIVTDSEVREDIFLFGEATSQVIVTVNEEQEENFLEFILNSGTRYLLLGHVTKGKMVIDDEHYGFVPKVKTNYFPE